MILTFVRSPASPSLARRNACAGFNTQFFPVPPEQRRISNGSFCRRYWPPPLEYSYGLRIRALTDDEGKINTSSEQEIVLPRNSEEQQQLDSNGSPFGELFKLLKNIYTFTRPYTMIGNVITITSISLLPLRSLTEVSPAFFWGVLQAMIVFLLAQVYVSGVNQIYDVEIDKINKPYLPLASGAFSMEFGVALVCMSLLGSLGMGLVFHSPPLFFAALVGCLLGSAYSIEVPFLRWKKNPFLTSTSMIVARAFLIPFTTFIHIQKYTLGRPVLFTSSLFFASCFSILMSIIIALSKDIPDIDGDRLFGFDSLLTVRLGKDRVFWICISLLMLIYGAGMGIGVSSSFLLSKLVIVLSHFLLACIVLRRALSIDLDREGFDFYMFVWKLMYVEYILVPFVR